MKKKTSGIYMIRNLVSGKVYVGRSKNIEQRWLGHQSESKRLRRTVTQLYLDMHELGVDKFEMTILFECAQDLPYYELLYALENNAFYPFGYNLGGTKSGWLSNELLLLIPPELKERWKQTQAEISKAGAKALKGLRQNSEYEKRFRAIKSAASVQRESNIKTRRTIDQDYDALMHKKRSHATNNRKEGYQYKGSIVFKQRMANDPEFAKQVRENRAKAAKIGWDRRKNASLA